MENYEFFKYILLVTLTLLTVTILSYIGRRGLDFLIKKNSKQLKVNPTNFVFLKNSLSFLLFSIGILWIFYKIPYFKSLGTALFAGAGVLAAILGFASQKAVSNIIGGLFILIFKPFRIDDIIELSSSRKGVVEEITLRHTVIKDYENRRVVIPNSQISEETIVNSSITDQKIRKHIDIGIAYDAVIDLAMQIMRKEILAHALFIDNRTDQEKKDLVEPVIIKVISLGDFAVTLRAYVWTGNNDEAFILMCDVLKSVKAAFDKAGVEIPFPYRTLVFKNSIPNKSNDLPTSNS